MNHPFRKKWGQNFLVDTNLLNKIANTIIGMGKDLNISVIAEGVETKDEYKALESANCNKYQGYYFSKPLTSSQFKNIL